MVLKLKLSSCYFNLKVPFIPVTLASTVENKIKFVALISYCGFTITSAPELL
ncbi:MAG: hypothetical protein CM15mP101_15030 [Flavobacteriaceae bacterium]|nr:MAG: hypothetical protein CM15mP101_15030 [Flavobacteriaceae bacterium]